MQPNLFLGDVLPVLSIGCLFYFGKFSYLGVTVDESPSILYMLGGLPMNNKDKNDTKNVIGTICVDEDGTQYFVVGKIRIKVSEHFANNGKTLTYLH